MKIEIMTKRQIKQEVKKQVEAREFKMQKLIELLQKRIMKLEEELSVRT